MDCQPQGPGDEGVGRAGARGLVERAAPRRQVVEGDSRCTGNDAVKLFRKVLCSLEALATTSGAAEIVGLGVLLAVEALGDLLANSDASLQPAMVSTAQRIRFGTDYSRAIRKVLDNLRIVVEGLSARAVVAVICANRCEPQTRRIRQIRIRDATVQSTVACTSQSVPARSYHFTIDSPPLKNRPVQLDGSHASMLKPDFSDVET
jgi:hypothetical protein